MTISERTSNPIPKRTIVQIALAAEFAHYMGTPLNRFCTINLSRAGISLDRAQQFRETFLARARDWLGYYGSVLHYVWVLENQTALNLHMLLHVPPRLRAGFARMQRRWLKQAGALCVPAGTIHTEQILRRDPFPFARDGVYLLNLQNCLAYMMKGANPEVCFPFGIEHEPQGDILGKRVAASESLGTAARSKAGWEPPDRRLILPLVRHAR